MKLASLNEGRDGRLVVVSRDLAWAADASAIAPTLQAALDDWALRAPELQALFEALQAGTCAAAFPLVVEDLAAPLPRAWQWLDGSAFENHGALMQKAFNLPPIETDKPLMYQGMSHQFLSATEEVRGLRPEDGVDFEGEFGIITDAVPMGITPQAALSHIRLCVLINDWSLRTLAPVEMKTGFGWIQAKPATALGPVAVTPDELGADFRDGRIQATMRVHLNGQRFGEVPATQMAFSFAELIAHAAHSRTLCAGTVIGSGTVSSTDWENAGSACISERRAIDMIRLGAPATPFMQGGDQVRIEAKASDGTSPFGAIDQRVA